MQEIDNFFAEHARKDAEGKLTVGEAIFGYYRLLEGTHAGRVIIKTCANIDGEPIIFYANGLVWNYVSKLKDVRCESVGVKFSDGIHAIDRSQATWYPDNSNEPQHYEW